MNMMTSKKQTLENVAGNPFMPVTTQGTSIQLAMQDLFLTGKILPIGARLWVKHTFTSAEPKPVEVVYAFILPRDAALRRFRITGEGFSSQSKLLPVKEAKRTYEDGIEGGHLSSLAQVYRDGMVNLNVGNIKPGETVTVLLEIMAGVDLQDDSFRFRFPFTLAPTYHAKARSGLTPEGDGEMQLPEDEFGDLILPTFKKDPSNLHRIGFDLEVMTPAEIAEVGSPSHAIRLSDLSGQGARVQLATDHGLPDRDLVLDVRTKADFTGVVAGKGKDGRCHFAGIVASPSFGKAKTISRRLVFLLDRSGSMQGERIRQAKNAILACIGTLGAKDQIGFVAFDDHSDVFRPSLELADQPTRNTLKDFLSAVDARGGTELRTGIKIAVGILGKEGGDIFLVTDGEVSGTEDILATTKGVKVRIHSLGINSSSQDRFLTLISRQTGGVSRFVTPNERVDVAALELFAATGTSVASNIRVSAEGANELAIDPDPASMVYEGHPLVILGSMRSDKAKLVVDSDGSVHKHISLPVEMNPAFPADMLRLLQGARLITELESQLPASSGEDRKVSRIEARLEKLSRQFGLASRVMALVAVVERKGDKAGQIPETRVVPVGLPQDEEMGAYFATSVPSLPCPSGPPVCSPPDSCCMSRDSFLYQAAPKRSVRVWAHMNCSPRPVPPKPEEVSGIDLAMTLAGMLEADGGMPGRNDQERLAATLIAIMTLLDLWSRDGVGPFAAQTERMVDYVKNVDQSGIAKERRTIINQVLSVADAFMKAPGKMNPFPQSWSKTASKIVVRRKPKPDQAWAELEKKIQE